MIIERLEPRLSTHMYTSGAQWPIAALIAADSGYYCKIIGKLATLVFLDRLISNTWSMVGATRHDSRVVRTIAGGLWGGPGL